VRSQAAPELAALAPLLPRADLSDLAAARALTVQFQEHGPAYQSARSIVVDDLPQQRIRIFRAAQVSGPMPALLYLRAGGFVLGTLAGADNQARQLADELDVAVVVVDYRSAPEHPYPAAIDDCYAALTWATSDDAAAYGIDPQRVAVLGDSAGGGLAAGLALLARDRNGPRISHLFLDAPTIDDRCATPSAQEFADTPIWRGLDTPIVWRHYLAGLEPVPIYAAPARADVDQLAGLPPVWVATYQLDPTRDEVLQFAFRLVQAGVATDLVHHAGAFHMAHTIPGTRIGARMLATKFDALRLAFGPQAA
jgi:acetyl esterase/lipase